MPNPFDFVHEIREANEKLLERLDRIIELLELIRNDTDAIWRNE